MRGAPAATPAALAEGLRRAIAIRFIGNATALDPYVAGTVTLRTYNENTTYISLRTIQMPQPPSTR